jgi:KaiC/GvpD/RAD55 family RecA-like ATPase
MEQTDEQGPDEGPPGWHSDEPWPEEEDAGSGDEAEAPAEEPPEEEPAEGRPTGRSVSRLSPEQELDLTLYRENRQLAEQNSPPYVDALGFELELLNRAKLEWTSDLVLTTPYAAWNSVCGDEGGLTGLARGWHVMVAGNTGMGKSLVAINLAAHAVKSGEKVGIISLEMSKPQLMTRYLAIHTGKEIRKLEWGPRYDEETALEANALVEENHEEKGGILITNDRRVSNLEDIIASMQYLHEFRGVTAFVTDYLQLAWTGNAEKMSDRITEVSHAIQGTAADLGVVSIGVSQFNRQTSGSGDKPKVQGMMGGSALENDSDQVLLLDHTTYKETGMSQAMIKLLVAKNRHGSCGEIPLMWDYTTLQARQTDAREFERDD